MCGGGYAVRRFSPVGEDGRPVVGAVLYAGDYEPFTSGTRRLRAQPIADTDPATPLGDTFQAVPIEMRYTATAPAQGQVKTTFTAKPGQTRDLPVKFRENLAGSTAGATVTGEGVNVANLIDGREGTIASTVANPTSAQRNFTIDLLGGRQVVRRVQVSGLTGPNSSVARFQTLRQFEIQACDAKGRVTCTQDADYRTVYTSSPDAFPGTKPRPVPGEMLMRSFDIPQTAATHLRFRPLANQCEAPLFRGEIDQDPRTTTDCVNGYTGNSHQIGIAEVQVMRH